MDSEQERATFYQEHKDDPDTWEDPEPTAPTKGHKGLSISITVRFPAEEAALIRRMAEDLGITYSEVVRKAVIQLVRPTVSFKSTDASANLFYNLGGGRTGSIHSRVELIREAPPSSFTAPSGAAVR